MGDSFTHLHVAHRVLDARRCGAGRASWWRRRRPTASRRSASPTTATCTGSSTSTRRAERQGIKPIIGTEAYMAHEHRTRAAGAAGPHRRHRRRRRGRQEALLPPHAAGRDRHRLPQPHPALEPGLPRGLLLQAPGRLGAARAHHEGLIATTGCLGGHVLQALLAGDERGALEKAARLQDIFGRDNLFVELQDHGIAAAAPDQPEAARDRPQASARRCSPPTTATTPTATTTWPTTRCCACRPARCMSDPKRFKFEGDQHYLKTAAEMRHLFARGARGVRQHAVDRRAGRRHDRVRQAPAARRSRCPRAFTPTTRLPPRTSPSRAPASGGATRCPDGRSSASPTSCRSSPTWGSARTSSSCGT